MFIFIQFSPLEEPHITKKRMKTESISEDMETENTNGNEETVGTDKGILKGEVLAVKKLFCRRPSAEYKCSASAATHEISCASVIAFCSRGSSLCYVLHLNAEFSHVTSVLATFSYAYFH